MSDPTQLLAEIEAFIIQHEMNATQFGVLAKNDSALVFRLREGGDVYTKTATELRRFMENYRRPLERTRPERRAAHA
ncbi:hypothetical protein [uncultured Hyphomicrobium sp.]|uniref:hypothetical protein n=1 Tax=uncultured Hyphomicrobium sp. TaxID=194373 RepID=UPI0025F94387|nr:hypothetical protein [uncultured Hyphomicrobium sp.]